MAGSLRGVISVDAGKCTNCQRCIAACPVKMCNNGSGNHVSLDDNLCIGCGSCITACAHGARYGLDDIDEFFSDIKKGVKMVAIVAPAAIVSFKGKDLELNGYLKSIGIKAVFDVSFGAELTTKSYIEYIKKEKPDCVISQPCPALVTFCEIYRPELLKQLAPVDSPMGHTIKMIREYYPQYRDCKVAVISPCFAKRREFDETELGDYNVTIVHLEKYFKANNINISTYPKVEYENPMAERGVLYSAPGGLLRTAERFMPGITAKTRKIEGSQKVSKYLANFTEANRGRKPPYLLIDCLNCENGCNEGAGTSNKDMHEDVAEGYVEERMRARQEYWTRQGHGEKGALRRLNKAIDEHWREGLYSRKYTDRSAYFRQKVKEPTPQQIQQIYTDMHKTGDKDILNCGACGYANCEQMAVAVYNGLNKPANCKHYVEFELKQNSEKVKTDMQDMIERVVGQSTDRLTENKSKVTSLSDVSRKMASSVDTSSSAVEEMIANINSIKSSLEQNATEIEKLSAATNRGKEEIASVANYVSLIEEHSKGLEGMSDMIQEIAEQTNLLAMNAAIEAAHAGESGKGFAVVADEIRKLAESSNKEAAQISQVLKKVTDLIASAYSKTDSAQKGFEHIVKHSQSVIEQEAMVSKAIAEQSEGGEQVLNAVEQMRALTREVTGGSDMLLKNTDTILEALHNLGEAERKEVENGA